MKKCKQYAERIHNLFPILQIKQTSTKPLQKETTLRKMYSSN